MKEDIMYTLVDDKGNKFYIINTKKIHAQKQFNEDITKANNKITQLQSNWKELKKWAKEELSNAEDDMAQEDFIKVLDRMEELESRDSE